MNAFTFEVGRTFSEEHVGTRTYLKSIVDR